MTFKPSGGRKQEALKRCNSVDVLQHYYYINLLLYFYYSRRRWSREYNDHPGL